MEGFDPTGWTKWEGGTPPTGDLNFVTVREIALGRVDETLVRNAEYIDWSIEDVDGDVVYWRHANA